MPRARRNKIVSLTKTPKRNTRSAKAGHMDSVRDAAAEYPTCVVFLMANQRTTYLQEVRSLWKANSKIFVGKNRVVAKAIGSDPESEARPGISGISKRLEGPVGVLFTTSAPDEVQEWFDDYARDDFARAGSVATRDVVLAAGPVMLALEEQEPLPHSLEPRLRQLGMPTELRRGVPTLTEEFVVCKAGDRLTTEKAQILKHLLLKDAKFRLVPIAHWTEETGEVQPFALSAADEALVKRSQQAGRSSKLADGRRKAARAAGDDADAMLDGEDDDDGDDDDGDDDGDDDDDDDDAHMMMPAGV